MVVNVFKKDIPEAKRISLSTKLFNQYPDRIPVIVQGDKQLKLKKQKFLAPKNMTVANLLTQIRNQTETTKSTAIFLFSDKTGSLIPINRKIIDIYDKYHDQDGFLYIHVSIENTFGGLYLFDNMSCCMFEFCRQMSVETGINELLESMI